MTRKGSWRLPKLRHTGCALAVLCGLALGAAHAADEDDELILVPVKPYGVTPLTELLGDFLGVAPGPVVMYVAVPPGSGITGGGLALDAAGNVYVSDFGQDEADGRIVMLPKDGRPRVVLMREVPQPSDIEISPDGRSLIMAGPDGALMKQYFGVSVRVNFGGFAANNPVVFLKTDLGTLAATMASDGYFHFAEVLQPAQITAVVDIIIVNGADIYSRYQVPLQAWNGALTGQTLIDITLP